MRMPNIDIIAIWKGHGYCNRPVNPNLFDSKCRVRIWQGDNYRPTFVVFSDLDEEGSGTSITNSSENLATLIRQEFNIESALWFEHYPRHNTSEKIQRSYRLKEEVSQVVYSWHPTENRFHKPSWVYINREQAEQMIGGSLTMENYQLVHPVRLQ